MCDFAKICSFLIELLYIFLNDLLFISLNFDLKYSVFIIIINNHLVNLFKTQLNKNF